MAGLGRKFVAAELVQAVEEKAGVMARKAAEEVADGMKKV